MTKTILLIIGFLLLIPLIIADTLTTFTDGETSCNVTSNDSITCSINLTGYTSVSSANMSVSGIDSASWNLSLAIFNHQLNTTSLDMVNNVKDMYLSNDGTKLYLVDDTLDRIHQLNLSLAWDLTSPSIHGYHTVSSGIENSIYSINFNNDGTKLYLGGNDNLKVYEYNLSISWDITTLVYHQDFYFGGNVSWMTAIKFSEDGTKMFVLGITLGRLIRYDLSTAWDISTAVIEQGILANELDDTPSGLWFKPDGTRMYLTGDENNIIIEYSLSIPYNITTLSHVTTIDVSLIDTQMRGMYFKSDGTNMFWTGSSNNSVYRYDISGNYPSSPTISIDGNEIWNSIPLVKGLTESIFNNVGTDQISIVSQTNGNIAIAYRDNAYAGNLNICNSTGGGCSETEFNNVATISISILEASDGGLVIAYGNNSASGVFAICNSSGGDCSKKIFNSANSYYIDSVELSNGNLVVVYTDAGDSSHGNMVICNSDGESCNEITFNMAGTSDKAVTQLSNGNIAIAFKDGGDSSHGNMVICNSEGSSCNETTFHTSTTSYIDIIETSENSIAISFQDSTGGSIAVCDINGGSCVITEFVSGTTLDISMVELSSNVFGLAYKKHGDSGEGAFTICDLNVENCVETIFNLDITDYIKLVETEDEKLAVAFRDRGNSDKGTIIVTDEMSAYGTTSDFASSLTAGVINYLNISALVWGKLSLDTLTIIASANTLPNQPTVNSPSDSATKQALSVSLNVTVTDPDGDAMNISFFNNATDVQIGSTQTNIVNGSTAQVTWSGLSAGTTYSWYVNATDGSLTNQSSVWSFTTSYTPTLAAEDTYGEVTAVSPPTSEDIIFNITCTDPDSGETITGYVQLWNGSTSYGSVQNSTVTNNTENTIHTLSSTYTAKGETWTGEYWCGDGISNSSKQNDSVTIVNTAPLLSIISPTNNDHSNQNLTVTFSPTDIDLDTINCSLIVNGTIKATNASITNGSSTQLTANLDSGEGLYGYYVSCNDGSETTNSSLRNYTFDTVSPDITWYFPLQDNSSTVSSPTFNINITANDLYLYRVNMTITNSTGGQLYQNYSGDIDQEWYNMTDLINLTGLSSGTYTIEVSATDDHTLGELTDLKKGKKGESELIFNDAEFGMIISSHFVEKSDKLTDTPGDFVSYFENVYYRDYITAYKFGYNFTVLKPETKIILNISANNTAFTYRQKSGIIGHFVWGNGKYYTDFEDAKIIKVNGIEVPAEVIILSQSASHILIKIEPITPLKGGDFVEVDPVTGGLNSITEYVTFVYDSDPDISNINLNLIDFLNGNQTYNITYNATDEEVSSLTCYVTTQDGDKSLSYNSSLNICEGQFILNQSGNNTFIPKASDGVNIGVSSTLRGVEIVLNQYLADSSQTNNLSIQHFLKQYNFSNNLSQNYTNISWSLNATDSAKTINLTSGSTTHNSEITVSADYIQEDSSYTIAGDTFIVDTGYNIYKTLMLNNTLSVTLPEIMIGIELDYYDANTLAEKQNGILWPDLNSSYNTSHILFNLSSLNSSSAQQYRYSYDAILADWSGESTANYELSGEYRLWSLDRTYFFNFPMANKTMTTDIGLSSISEWAGKTATWASTITDNTTNASITHTTTDHATYASLSLPNVNSSTGYDYQLLYYTLGSVTSSSDGGGGGGGGGTEEAETIDEAALNETIERIITDKTAKKGTIQFYYPGHERLISFLPTKDFYKEVVIKAVGGPVQDARVFFSDNIDSYFTGAICDMRTSDCYTEISLTEGEEKYIFIMGDLSDELFAEQLLKETRVQGFVQVYSNSNPVSNPYNLSIEKAQLFDFTYNITKKIDSEKITQKAVFYATVLAIVTVLGVLGFSILRFFRVV